MRPAAIISRLKLKEPIYSDTAAYGHMGRTPEIKELSFQVNGSTLTKQVETFTWEKLDFVDKIKDEFGL
jgi:S-adenosylmethionine synthetase